MEELHVGVVGYSHQKFNKEKAIELIEKAYDKIEKIYPNTQYNKTICSGLTNIGINKLAFEEGIIRNWKTYGIACKRANEYELFPTNKKLIIGEEWGDESETFLNHIDILIRIGGGPQSLNETQSMKEMNKLVFEYELELKNE